MTKKDLTEWVKNYLNCNLKEHEIKIFGMASAFSVIHSTKSRMTTDIIIGHLKDRERDVHIIVNALQNGDSVEIETKRLELNYSARCNTKLEGSKQYTWDKTGNKVLCDRVILEFDKKTEDINTYVIDQKYIKFSDID